MSGRVLYLSGPMTGYPNNNLAAFDHAEELLTNADYQVISPANAARITAWELTWTEYMQTAIRAIYQADGLALLPGWPGSKGAQIEVTVATCRGIPVAPVADWLRREYKENEEWR
ncbi:MAG: DUF4406 domain-containing protein [Bifidobacteriaceae bacterium]|nr:DUF4406 domain-containing protein [Bifidobacteriaceae bacterium]